ncbi:endolytic transglycosylase MltG [Patescibacteria group bacterium]|nr:endolytic transglycosylase MltG [Patescibacteria group bacterium]
MKKIILVIIILIVIGVLSGTYLWYQSSMKFNASEDIAIEIIDGEGIKEISQKLADNNAIDNPYIFIVYAILIDGEGYDKIVPGLHTIPAQSDIPQIFSLLQANPNREISVTLPEGITSVEFVAILTDKLSVSDQELRNYLLQSNYYQNLDTVISKSNLYEGFLFPDTYRFYFLSTPEEIFNKIFNNFQIRWEATIDGPIDYEKLIIASIIEKEASNDFHEKQIISGIFHKRLENGIPLGANSTLNYILDEPQRVFTSLELNYESDYNSYLNSGLPPTPICNPGLNSIVAATQPLNTEYWYFLHTPDGQIVYAKTLAEQEANIEQYLS